MPGQNRQRNRKKFRGFTIPMVAYSMLAASGLGLAITHGEKLYLVVTLSYTLLAHHHGRHRDS